jgi:serine/threonine protein kinase
MAIKELRSIEDLSFAAALDHKNIILTHTDTEMINKAFKIPDQQKLFNETRDIKIFSDTAPNGSAVFGFLKNMTFADVEIGKVYVALNSAPLHNTLNRLKYFYVAWCLFSAISIIVAFYLLNRTAKAKASNILKEYENMDRIGPYVLLRKMARGGMAELFLSDYLSEDGFRKQVAVKRILPHLAENTDFINMFTREARIAALLHHPNIVQILDYKKIDNAYLIAMEYIDGKNLGEILSTLKHGIPYELTGYIISEICKGLDYSHNKKDDLTGEPMNIVHRDISPQNILVSFRGEVKISDFGISKAQSEPSLTQVGVIKGKMSYLSPEQAMGEQIDARVDIYALGLVFYEILTGKRVYQFDSDIEAIRTIPVMDIKPVIEELPDLPVELNNLVMKCLERKKELRFQSAQEVFKELVKLKDILNINVDISTLEDFMRKNFKKNDN